MGIVSSTFASLAIRFAWNCQRFLDPRYRYIEASSTKRSNDDMAVAPMRLSVTPDTVANGGGASVAASGSPSTCAEHRKVASGICLAAENNSSLHQENRHRRAAQHRYRRRPSSFDVSLIIRNKNKTGNTTPSGLVTHSTPSTLKRQPAPGWDTTSTSASSTDSSDSESEFMYAPRTVLPNDERLAEKSPPANSHDPKINHKQESEYERSMEDENPPDGFAMSAAEEAAFRMTVGRGHFSRSKKDRFLNNLRLEKRLNGLSKEFFELTCRAHNRAARRRHSGDLRRIV